MDVDFSYYFKFIFQMIEKMKEGDYDIVMGICYVGDGGVYGWDLKRKLMSKGVNIFVDIVFWFGVSDLMGSFRLYKWVVLEKLFESMDVRGFMMQMVFVVMVKVKGYFIGEVLIFFVDRVYGDSKLGGEEIVEYVKGVLQFWWFI